MKQYIQKCLSRENLTVDEAADALEQIMTGQASEIQVAGLLIALRAKGETVDELVGFARTMREKAVRIEIADPDAVDMCGTGGDGLGTFNISTVASFLAAGAGVTIAKHGNRSVSSRSGSADLLTALGVNIQIPPERVQACIEATGIGFLFAPMFHPAMKYAGRPRVELGVRTIFNMLGPITNPARVKKQLVGAFHPQVAADLARALQQLSATHACVVHSSDGLDEVSVSGPTLVFEAKRSEPLHEYTITPHTLGIPEQPFSSVTGGTAEENAVITREILCGQKVPARHIVVANAAFGIYVAGKAANLSEGVAMASESLDSGKALRALERLLEFTNRP